MTTTYALRLRDRVVAGVAAFLLLSAAWTHLASAQQYEELDTVSSGGITEYGTMFEVTATNPVNIYRLGAVVSSTGTRNVEVWYRQGGMGATPTTAPPTTGWNLVGTASVNFTQAYTSTQVPVDINLQMGPNDTYGFIVISANRGITYTTASSPSAATFTDSNIEINAYGYGLRYGGGNPPWNTQWSPRMYNGTVWYELQNQEDLVIDLAGPTGVQTVDNNSAGSTGDGVVLAEFTIESFQEAWTVNEIEFGAAGTGDAAAAFSEVTLYEDTSSSGTFDGATVDDEATSTPALAFDPVDNTYTAELIDTQWPASTQRRFFLVGTLNGSAQPGETFEFELSDIDANSTGSGAVDGIPSGFTDGLEIDQPRLDVIHNGPSGLATIPFDEAGPTGYGYVLLDVTLSAANDDVAVDSLTLDAIGSGDSAAHYELLALYEDTSGSGTFEGATADTLINSTSGISGSWSASLGGLTVSASAPRRFFVVAIFNGTAPNAGYTYGVRLNQVNLVSPGSVPIDGPPVGLNPVVMIETPLSVASFTPVRGTAGLAITVEGTGFVAPLTVSIGGELAEGEPEVNDAGTEITGLTVPPGSGRDLPIVLEVNSEAPLELEQTFTYGSLTSSSRGCTTVAAPTSSEGGWWGGLLALFLLGSLLWLRRRGAIL